MSTRLTHRARRSTLALLTGAALATLMSVTAAAAAPLTSAADTSDVGATVRADVWMKDFDTDTGLEPHGNPTIWMSPDIKVCNTAVECAWPGHSPIVGARNYVFVTLRNPGPYGSNVTETGQIYVYWSNPGAGTAWDSDWNEIGWKTVPVSPGVTKVIIPWDNVPGPGHFCLLARWVSPNDPFNFEGPETSVNTQYNNNIAWRNVDTVVVEAGGSGRTLPYTIGNPLDRANRNTLVFTEVGTPLRAAGGRLVANLGPALYERWVAGGKVGKSIRDLGRYQIEIVDPATARLDNLTLQPKEKLPFSLTFNATTPIKETIGIRVAQFGPDSTGAQFADRGGVHYNVTVVAPRR
ncbi:hypothetical protein O7606_21475 [Micromonospora sp. WMMD882]|uniref:hypothetical protein n=1 Tax=Micromonospora sp. WMMD882 TaxID=3015151 RepID=UPI00248D22E9|nr:hypothetical protein [Micromonospora sp. WMMD882]WBB78760.1 hypothetical protein O7606_21475 [Micromonospora sp. WMMD882]